MSLLPPTPATLEACRLHGLLRERSQPDDGLAGRVAELVRVAEPLLGTVIAGPFRQFTLHDPAHARKLVHIAPFVMAARTLENLSALDLAVFIMAAYIHDLGMAISAQERAELVASPALDDELLRWPEMRAAIAFTRRHYAEARAGGRDLGSLEARLFQLQEATLASLIRRQHATPQRYGSILADIKRETGRRDLFSVRGSSFEDELIEICVSHNLNPGVLLEMKHLEEERFPRFRPVGGLALNVQFCAALLRVVDILDFDRERTPRPLFEALGIAESDVPGAEVSLLEWTKHMAVTSLQFQDDDLIVFAECTHPVIEQTVRHFCALIERELRDTAAVLRRNRDDVLSTYGLSTPVRVRPHIKSVGYVFKELSFHLDGPSITQLLMGEALYADPVVAVRELVQNAVDACRLRQLIASADYAPKVVVTSETDDHGRLWIQVSDDGVGMDESVLFEFFFAAGRSYYRSPEFESAYRRVHGKFVPISRFGIGVLSVFLLADRLEVSTANLDSPRGDTVRRHVRVENRFGLAFVTETRDESRGTTVRIRLKDDDASGRDRRILDRVGRYLQRVVVRPPVPVEVVLGARHFRVGPEARVDLVEHEDAPRDRPAFVDVARRKGGPLERLRARAVAIDVAKWRTDMRGRVIIFLAIDPGGTVGNQPRNGHYSQEDFVSALTGFAGNRVTVDGIAMGANLGAAIELPAQGRLVGVIDIDVRGDAVTYDVARSHLNGESTAMVRDAVREVVTRALADAGIAVEFRRRRVIDERKLLTREDLADRLDAAEQIYRHLVPEEERDQLAPGLHQEIAHRLGISGNEAYWCLDVLAISGRIPLPDEPQADGPDRPSRLSAL